jgi:DNA mismatch repair ATPase MutL
MIRFLPQDIVERIKSSSQIANLADAVMLLVHNAVDADATTIQVVVSSHLDIDVIDSGLRTCSLTMRSVPSLTKERINRVAK